MELEYKVVWLDDKGHYSEGHHSNRAAQTPAGQHRFDWKPLNDLGAAGWELVSIVPVSFGEGIGSAFFKRPLQT